MLGPEIVGLSSDIVSMCWPLKVDALRSLWGRHGSFCPTHALMKQNIGDGGGEREPYVAKATTQDRLY